MKPQITTAEAGRLGGIARKKKLSKARRHEIALNAGKAAGLVHKLKAKQRKNLER